MNFFFVIALALLPFVVSQENSIPKNLTLQSTVDTYSDDGIKEVTELYTLKADGPCQLDDMGEPADVHHLTPKDIKIVAAIGDSITAALYAKVTDFGTILLSLLNKHKYEYRGVSWSIGGDEGVSTLPNMLKTYNPNLQGYSIGTGKEGTSNAANNLAVSGAVSNDLPKQADQLVNKLQGSTEWKVITLFIGGNDLCAACSDSSYSDSNYYNQVQKTIDILLDGLTNAFVNLVQPPDIKEISQYTASGCGLLHEFEKLLVCKCMGDSQSTQNHAKYVTKIDELQDYFNNKIDNSARDDFVVVVQPFFEKIDLPSNAVNYFSADCFHFSQLGHSMSAIHLWNNMISPIGEKSNTFSSNEILKCPAQNAPYFYTHKTIVNTNLFGTQNNNNNNKLYEDVFQAQATGLSGGNMAGIVVGGILLVAVLIFSLTIILTGSILLVRKYRANRSQCLQFDA